MNKKEGMTINSLKQLIIEIKDSKSTKNKKTETKKLDKIKRPLWAKINKNDFDLLIQDIYDNLNNDEFKTTVNKKADDLKNSKKFLLKISAQKISEEDAKELYSDLITPDIIELKNTKCKGKKRDRTF